MDNSYFNDFVDAVADKKIASIGFGGYSDADTRTANVSEIALDDGTTLLLRPPKGVTDSAASITIESASTSEDYFQAMSDARIKYLRASQEATNAAKEFERILRKF